MTHLSTDPTAGASVPFSGPPRWAAPVLARVLPGVALCFGVALLARCCEAVEARLFGAPYRSKPWCWPS